MAQLKFSGIQPVEFNGRDCTPKLDTGKRLRLERLKFDEANMDETDRVLASCFPDDEEYVAQFLRDKMTPADKHILQAYLLNGEKAIAMLDRTSDVMAEKALDKMTKELDKQLAKDEEETHNA